MLIGNSLDIAEILEDIKLCVLKEKVQFLKTFSLHCFEIQKLLMAIIFYVQNVKT